MFRCTQLLFVATIGMMLSTVIYHPVHAFFQGPRIKGFYCSSSAVRRGKDFVNAVPQSYYKRFRYLTAKYSSDDNNGMDNNAKGGSNNNNNEDGPENGVFFEDLNWRIAKVKLEDQNLKRILKSGPRFLPYEECRKWVQQWNRWESEEEWKDWIEMGEKRNSYIPARPDEYYAKQGKWKGWDHFLKEGDEEHNTNDENDSRHFQ